MSQGGKMRLVGLCVVTLVVFACRTAMAIFCTACGTENPNESKFCSNCGRKMVVRATEVSIATHRWPELAWKKHLFTKATWGMSPQMLSRLLNNAPLKLVDRGRDTGTFMIADAVDMRIRTSDAQTGAFIQALAHAQGRGPTHFTMRYGPGAVMDPSFTFIALAGESKLAAISFKNLPDEGRDLRKYMNTILQNRKTNEDGRSYVDTWADSTTLIKGTYWEGDHSYEVKIINWPAYQDIGVDHLTEVNAYLESWHKQREEKRAACEKCDGTGRIWIEPTEQECPQCDGRGFYYSRGRTGTRRWCEGIWGRCDRTGKIKVPGHWKKCPLCQGSGLEAD